MIVDFVVITQQCQWIEVWSDQSANSTAGLMLNHDEAYSCRKLSASGTVSNRDAAAMRISS